MKTEIPAWSHTMLECFEQCEKKWYHKYILGEKEPSSPALEYGNKVHKALEENLKNDAPLPEDLQKYYSLLAAVRLASKGKKQYVELRLGVDNKLKPVEFFDKGVWGRSAADVVLKNEDALWVGDWKTGKIREKETQMKILAMFLFLHFPAVNKITGCNLWLEDGKIGVPYNYTRDMLPALVTEQLVRIKKMKEAFERMNLPPSPTPLCGWCYIKSCPHWKER